MRNLINKLLDTSLREFLISNSNLTEEDMCLVVDKFLDIVDTLNTNKEKQREYCRTEAYQYLRISRSSFDAKVNSGILPKGHKVPGKGPVWYKKDLDEYLKKYDNKKKTPNTNLRISNDYIDI